MDDHRPSTRRSWSRRITYIAQMVNVLQAMIPTDKDKMVLTPTDHVYKMYLPFQDATFVPVCLVRTWPLAEAG